MNCMLDEKGLQEETITRTATPEESGHLVYTQSRARQDVADESKVAYGKIYVVAGCTGFSKNESRERENAPPVGACVTECMGYTLFALALHSSESVWTDASASGSGKPERDRQLLEAEGRSMRWWWPEVGIMELHCASEVLGIFQSCSLASRRATVSSRAFVLDLVGTLFHASTAWALRGAWMKTESGKEEECVLVTWQIGLSTSTLLDALGRSNNGGTKAATHINNPESLLINAPRFSSGHLQ
ncbi:hypothetical protein B0H14DRAFT_3563280 [Mycena olivaceomarginata]|nr:hypothetical protein B0H14DRAFT_3563280 [Mycena olivaceomarginata]